MKPFLLLTALLVSACTASPLYGAISSQYQHLDPHSHTYSYGYADPNSQKHESRSHDGVTRGSYSYVDGHGHLQSVSYVADPHHGFNAVGTNLPKAPADHGPYAAAHAYVPYHHAAVSHYVPLTPAGVPVDTPEVQHAKAEHAAAHAAAAAAAAHGPHHHLYKRSLYAGPWAYASHVPLTHGGVPVDTPDVQAAKAEHYAAHAKVLGQLGHGHGAPIDTPEVQHAKAAHFAAVAEATARAGHGGGHDDGQYDGRYEGHYGGGPHYASGYQHQGPIHIPVIHNGVPVEPAEVQHARAAHLSALAAANHGPADYNGGQYDGGNYDAGHYDGGHGYANGYQHKGPIHIPVIHNGVPVEPAEVQHARAAHLSAVAAASHGSYHGSHGGHGGDDGQYRHYNQWK